MNGYFLSPLSPSMINAVLINRMTDRSNCYDASVLLGYVSALSAITVLLVGEFYLY